MIKKIGFFVITIATCLGFSAYVLYQRSGIIGKNELNALGFAFVVSTAIITILLVKKMKQ